MSFESNSWPNFVRNILLIDILSEITIHFQRTKEQKRNEKILNLKYACKKKGKKCVTNFDNMVMK